MVKEQSYFKERIFKQLGAKPKDIKIQVKTKFENVFRTVDMDIFSEDKDGNIKILVYTLDRELIHYDHKNATPEKPNINNDREQTFYITRLKVPQQITTKEGDTELKKYHIPKGVGTFPFFPPALIEKFEKKEKIKTLVLTEGYFKAFKGALHNIDIVGFSSITHYKDKETRKMYTDVLRIIETCQVENIIILYDGDCRNISTGAIEKEKDLYTRPFGFVSSAIAIRDLLNDLEKNIYFAHVNSDNFKGDDRPKGLDDLLIYVKETGEVVNDLNSTNQGNYFCKLNITASPKRLLNYFALTNVNQFYDLHGEAIKGRDFVFRGTRYKFNDQTGECDVIIPKAAKQYFRVGDSYYEFVFIPNKLKQIEKTFHRRLKSTIIDDHGQNFCKHIPKYKAFCNVPDHTNYVQIMDNCFNVYAEFEHEPDQEEDCPSTLNFIKHIFGDQFELGLDYLQLLYQKPTQILPILCLVSKENKTGKSTFAKLLKYIFTANCTIVGNEELSNSFNASWATKLLIICEESLIEKQVIIEKIKALSTADKIMMNAKGKDQVELDFFGKFILCSNNEDSFIRASNNDIRYWVCKVPVIKNENPHLLTDMVSEIPGFLAFLNKRQLTTKNETRMWFKEEIIKTDALTRLIENSRPKIEKELILYLREIFLDFNIDRLYLTTKDIQKEVFNGRYEASYINRILEFDLHIEKVKDIEGKEKVTQYKIPRWQQNGDGGFIRQDERKVGRPWVFLREQFVKPGETKEDLIETIEDPEEIVNDDLPF